MCGWWVVSFPFALKVSLLFSLSKRVFVGYRIPGWWLFVFQHFTDASPLSSDFLVLGKSALSVVVLLKATPFFLWALEHFLLALAPAELLKPMCGFHFWLNGLILEPTLTTVPVSQFSRSVSDPLQPHRLQHTRLPCPLSPRVAQIYVHWVGDVI